MSGHGRGLLVAALLASGCSSAGGGAHPPAAPTAPPSSPVLDRLLALPDAPAADVVAVWVCDVPVDTTDPTYAPDGVRLVLDPARLATLVGPGVRRWAGSVSHGQWDVDVVAGGTVAMGSGDTSRDCADEAIEREVATSRASPATVVLAVADAEHTAAAPGGWGTDGDAAACAPACSLAASRRVAYVGGADFHPDWGDRPPLDLVEHELGHTLGLPHSGGPGQDDTTSVLDVMSDSAAPRAVHPERRDAPDLIGVDRVALGWLDADGIVVAATDRPTAVELAPSTSRGGQRAAVLAVLPVDEHRIVTVELLVSEGWDDHLPRAGVAVHVVDDSAGERLQRRQRTVRGGSGTDLLGAGDAVEVEGWRIIVSTLSGDQAGLAVRPPDAAGSADGDA